MRGEEAKPKQAEAAAVALHSQPSYQNQSNLCPLRSEASEVEGYAFTL